MTVRELVNELTAKYIDWDLEVHVCVTDQPVKSGMVTSWKNFKIDRVDLFTPTWYESNGRRCNLVLERVEDKDR